LIKTPPATVSTLALALLSKQRLALFALLLAACCQWVCADTVYQTQDAFLHDAFPLSAQASEPKAAVFWLDKTTQDDISKILGHPYPQARLRYWRHGTTSVWILEEIGKEYPITAGFIINEGKIMRAQVLIYRETRGMEIHLPGFLAQFKDNKLAGDKLTNKVDGIAGATMSVNAMVKMAQVALMLNQKAQ
jgi:hypothetical protein